MTTDEEIKDMDILEFGRSISMITIDTPISIEFDNNYGQKKDRWWTSQREHLTVWCLHYPTLGVGEFTRKPNYSAKYMYNNFKRPETLLWLSEALGENKEVLSTFVEEIKEIKDISCQSACSILRKKIPFKRILELIKIMNPE